MHISCPNVNAETNIPISINIRDLHIRNSRIKRENARDEVGEVSAEANISNYKSITATL